MSFNKILLLIGCCFIISFDLLGNPVIWHWISYSPSDSWQPGQEAESSLVWHDLELLHQFSFDGIVTYGTLDSLCRIPRLARRFGFHNIIMGVWIDTNMMNNQQGIELAIGYHEDADAIYVGNEALFFNRVDTNYLKRAMDTIRFTTGKPVTTSEHWTMYFQPGYQSWLLQNCDFLFPILNPTDNGIFDPDTGALWVKAQFDSLRAIAGDSVEIIVKEAGWPTYSDSFQQRTWANEGFQDRFFTGLDYFYLEDTLSYHCFEAFDGWWKNWGPTQRYWGLFDSERHPKLYAQGLGIYESPSRYQNRLKSRIWSNGLKGILNNLSNEPIILFDINGRKVIDLKSDAIGMPVVPTGIYFIRFSDGVIYKTIITH
ncbi:MAG: hypothetical protein OEZ20_09055 [candidate division WOR-3 bacterium]|nr:hypothetical protein [candidate division WOR-3 bacterium]